MITRIQKVLDELATNEALIPLVINGSVMGVWDDGELRMFVSSHAPAVTLPAETVVAELERQNVKLEGSIVN